MEIDKKTSMAIISDYLKGIEDKDIRKKYHLTQKSLNEYKETVIKRLPTLFDIKEPTSYAIDYFQRMKNQRQLRPYLEENWNFTKSQCFHLNNIVSGLVRPTFGMIYTFREKIPPVDWFYKEPEERPEPIKFNPIYTNYSVKTWKELFLKKTCGHIFFDYLIEAKCYSTFCRDYLLDKVNLNNFIYQRRTKDGQRFYSRPTYPFVNALKKELHPDFWYMFPDEVPHFNELIRQIAADSIALHSNLD